MSKNSIRSVERKHLNRYRFHAFFKIATSAGTHQQITTTSPYTRQQIATTSPYTRQQICDDITIYMSTNLRRHHHIHVDKLRCQQFTTSYLRLLKRLEFALFF
ncbi:unnamed protein product [Cercopithifilaria johnstoni]|uniref:Uncharacterized protein n=1 Tax=Cercopithifilaria johnstoni TaxID=2874296 RepID=A0A8J2MC50_9BILA|nr:unnamed protein product [Cercopithifilaria johnstoni]